MDINCDTCRTNSPRNDNEQQEFKIKKYNFDDELNQSIEEQ